MNRELLNQPITGLGPIGALLEQHRRALLALWPSETPSIRPEVRPDGMRLHAKGAGGGGSTAVIMAEVVSEGADALLCTVDGGATTFAVMKPEPLRRSWNVADYSAVSRHIYFLHSTVAQVVDQAVWDQWGYVLSVKPNSLGGGSVQEEYQAIWPPYVDALGDDTTSTTVNAPRVVNQTFGRVVNVICARVSGAGRVNAADLADDVAGDTIVSFVDITPGRAWLPLDVITQIQEVYDMPGGTVIGAVDNQPNNS